MSETLTLDGWGGQGCSVVIVARDKSGISTGVFVTFRSTRNYGYPSLEIAEVRSLLTKMEAMDTEAIPTEQPTPEAKEVVMFEEQPVCPWLRGIACKHPVPQTRCDCAVLKHKTKCPLGRNEDKAPITPAEPTPEAKLNTCEMSQGQCSFVKGSADCVACTKDGDCPAAPLCSASKSKPDSQLTHNDLADRIYAILRVHTCSQAKHEPKAKPLGWVPYTSPTIDHDISPDHHGMRRGQYVIMPYCTAWKAFAYETKQIRLGTLEECIAACNEHERSN